MRPHNERADERLYARLMRLYPASFRRRYGNELLEVFRQERRQAAARGRSRTRFWVGILADLVASVTKRRLAPLLRQRHPRKGSKMNLSRELRQALRVHTRRPVVTLTALVTIALGVGATTTIFGAVYAVLLRTLPVHDESSLSVLRMSAASSSKEQLVFLRERTHAFTGIAAWSGWGFTVTGGGEPEALSGARVSADLFALLGTSALLGRTLEPGEDRPGGADVVVISHSLWQRRFGSAPDIVGRSIHVDGASRTVIGVMPAAFRFPSPNSELWVPVVMDPADAGDWRTSYLTLVGRLRDESTPEAAAADLRAAAVAWRDANPGEPETFGQEARVVTLRDHMVGPAGPALALLLGAVVCVLLIACLNVASLTLTSVAARSRELAVRSALGAGRGRIAAQLITESLLLAFGGGLLGVLIAAGGSRLLVLAMPSSIPGIDDTGLGGPVLGFALLSTIVAALIFAAPAILRFGRGSMAGSLRDGGRSSASRERRRLLVAVCMGEIALAVILVSASALVLESLSRLRNEFTGYEDAGVLAVDIDPPSSRYGAARLAAYWTQVVQSVRDVPGVESAGGIHIMPFSGDNWNPSLRVRGSDVPVAERPEVYWRIVTPGFFETMRIPLIAGRWFDERDDGGSAGVAVVSEALADRVFGTADPIGREIRTGFEEADTWVRIIGIVGDTRDVSLGADIMPMMYRPMSQWPVAVLKLMVRTDRPAATAVAGLRSAIWSIDRDVPVGAVRPLRAVIASSIAQPRLVAGLLTLFALLALTIGAVGVYGVLSWVVGLRRTEFGIRAALGASRTRILGSVLVDSLGVAATGIVLGIAGTLAVTRLLRSQLHETSPTDPAALILAAAVLLGASLLAAAVPAISASRTDPMRTMRVD